MKNYVTIATDISTDHRNKISTWACYIRHDGGAIKEVGRFKEFPKNTAVAETYALINALAIAKKNIPNWGQSKVIIHNEIEYVLRPILTQHSREVKEKDIARTEAIRSVALPILEEALSWERRKIKAHFKGWATSQNPAKYAINRWCDFESRKLLRVIREKEKNIR